MKINFYMLISALVTATLVFLSQYPLSIQIEAVTPLGSVKVHMLEQAMTLPDLPH